MIRWVVVALVVSSGTAFAQTASDTVSERCTARASLSSGDHACARIDLEAGHTRVLKLDRSFGSVVVGNEKVADVQVQDRQTLLITAKSNEGSTNLVLLDDRNQQIYSAEIVVSSRPENAPAGRVFAYSRKNLHDYYPYACTDGTCVRLKEEYQGEHTKDVFVPGLRQPPQLNVNSNNVEANAAPPDDQPGARH